MKTKIQQILEAHRDLLNIPEEYHIALVPGSDTGAIEMALWTFLGPRNVDVFAWEHFSKEWLYDTATELRLENIRIFEADYGDLPDLHAYTAKHDCVFVWNGTTSGVWVPNGDWIPHHREGLTICDATSAVFATDLPWPKLDIITWSWQKALGGEAAHGMIALSPRAVERLENTPAPRALPKIFRLTKHGKLNKQLFQGETLNTPSMLAIEDCLDALNWVKALGGCEETIRRSRENFKVIDRWVQQSHWIDFLAQKPQTRSTTSICLKITDPWFLKNIPSHQQHDWVRKNLLPLLEEEKVAYDIAAYITAPPGLRIWAGATIEAGDLKNLTAWLDWAYATAKTAA